MAAPVSATIPGLPEEERGRALLAVAASLFAPGHAPAAIIARAVAQVAAAFGAAAFFLPTDDSSGSTSPVSDFVTESLRADWRAAYPDPEAAFARATGATTILAPSPGDNTPRTGDSPGDWPWSSVALRGQAGLHGTLLVARPAPAFSVSELALLEQVAWPLAAALDRAARAATTEHHGRALSLLTTVDTLFSRRLDDVDLLFATLSDLVALLGSALGDSCALFVAERGQATLLLIDLFHADPVERERQRAALHTAPIRLGEGPIGEVALGGASRLIPRQDGAQRDPDGGADSWLCVPLHYDGRSLGALTVGRDRRDDQLAESDLRLCETIGRRVAAALTATELAQLAATARDLLADSPDPAFTLSIGGHLLAANAALCRLLGYSAPQLRERHIGDLLAPEERDATLELLASVIVGGAPLPAREWTLVRATGERRIIEVRVKVLSELGQPIEIHCAGRDLTARREDQRALARQGTELATLHIAGLTLADALEPDEIRRALLGAIRAALPCDDVTIYSLDNATMQPELSLQPGTVPPPEFPHGHPLIDESVLHGQSVLLNDAPSDPEFLPLGSSDPLHLLIAPLLAGG